MSVRVLQKQNCLETDMMSLCTVLCTVQKRGLIFILKWREMTRNCLGSEWVLLLLKNFNSNV